VCQGLCDPDTQERPLSGSPRRAPSLPLVMHASCFSLRVSLPTLTNSARHRRHSCMRISAGADAEGQGSGGHGLADRHAYQASHQRGACLCRCVPVGRSPALVASNDRSWPKCRRGRTPRLAAWLHVDVFPSDSEAASASGCPTSYMIVLLGFSARYVHQLLCRSKDEASIAGIVSHRSSLLIRKGALHTHRKRVSSHASLLQDAHHSPV
jgi:hypothetical protein